LFRKLVDDYEDGGETGGLWKVFYEIHGDGVPRFLWYRELFKEAKQTVTRSLHMGTGGAGPDILLDKEVQPWPNVFTADALLHSILPKVA